MRREEVLVAVCAALSTRNDGEAVSLLHSHYRFAPAAPTKHNAGPLQSTRVFIRDGFIDRYSGDRLIFPPVLRLISLALPADFPYHPNWRTTETHSAFWEVGATVDHVVPRCLGGSSDDSNLVTTSMARNSAKMNWSCEQLGWAVFPPGDMSTWDGLLGWFMTSIAAQPGLLMVKGSGIRQWHRAAGQLWPGP